jgi:hypothetical protein
MVIETRTQMIKSWTITLAVASLLVLLGKEFVYSFIFEYTSFLGAWLNNYLSIFIILAISIPLIKYIASNWLNK